MRKPKRIRIVASYPEAGQDRIDLLIGEEYAVKHFDSETKCVEVESDHFGGIIRLNPGEYEVV